MHFWIGILFIFQPVNVFAVSPTSSTDYSIEYCQSLLQKKKIYPLDMFTQKKLYDAAFKTPSKEARRKIAELWREQAADPSNPFQSAAIQSLHQALDTLSLQFDLVYRIGVSRRLPQKLRVKAFQYLIKLYLDLKSTDFTGVPDEERFLAIIDIIESDITTFLTKSKHEDLVVLDSVASAFGYSSFRQYDLAYKKIHDLMLQPEGLTIALINELSQHEFRRSVAIRFEFILTAFISMPKADLTTRVAAVNALGMSVAKIPKLELESKDFDNFDILLRKENLPNEISAPLERWIRELLPFSETGFVTTVLRHARSDLTKMGAIQKLKEFAEIDLPDQLEDEFEKQMDHLEVGLAYRIDTSLRQLVADVRAALKEVVEKDPNSPLGRTAREVLNELRKHRP